MSLEISPYSILVFVFSFLSFSGLLQSLGFPMIGSTPTAYALSKDKGLTRSVLSPMKIMPDGLIIKRYAIVGCKLHGGLWTKMSYLRRGGFC